MRNNEDSYTPLDLLIWLTVSAIVGLVVGWLSEPYLP